jgi:hypothetical protein
MIDPLRTLKSANVATMQLHQTSHPCLSQYFRGLKDRSADTRGRDPNAAFRSE